VGIFLAVSAAARALGDVTPPARSLVRIGAKLAARASAQSDWALEPGLPLVRAWIISHQYLPVLGQRSDDLVNIAAISAGRFLTLALLVLDDFEQPCCGPAELAELRCEHEVVDVSVEISVDEVLDLVVPRRPIP
jgi:hypothetical protein